MSGCSKKKSIRPILFFYYDESLVSSSLNSNLFRFHCARPNVSTYQSLFSKIEPSLNNFQFILIYFFCISQILQIWVENLKKRQSHQNQPQIAKVQIVVQSLKQQFQLQILYPQCTKSLVESCRPLINAPTANQFHCTKKVSPTSIWRFRKKIRQIAKVKKAPLLHSLRHQYL